MTYHNRALPLHGYSFEVEPEVPLSTERANALGLRHALEDLLTARLAYEQALQNVPRYTAQWNSVDYVRNEEQTLIAASHAFEDAVVASVLGRTKV